MEDWYWWLIGGIVIFLAIVIGGLMIWWYRRKNKKVDSDGNEMSTISAPSPVTQKTPPSAQPPPGNAYNVYVGSGPPQAPQEM